MILAAFLILPLMFIIPALYSATHWRNPISVGAAFCGIVSYVLGPLFLELSYFIPDLDAPFSDPWTGGIFSAAAVFLSVPLSVVVGVLIGLIVDLFTRYNQELGRTITIILYLLFIIGYAYFLFALARI
jgi:hypothetical protein